MRTILIDWFSDAVREYISRKEAVHLAASLVDRALPMFNIDKMRFQLVGITSMRIAVKYEEIFPPILSNTRHSFDGAILYWKVRLHRRNAHTILDRIMLCTENELGVCRQLLTQGFATSYPSLA
ncbi:Cyclin-like domain-containing protein [Caenorhabditis elegans]|uniref:Cyclin-like domain-containing protein n=1 Tax=Caenorhabditis elegans TaxID=6239 RepID=Q7Z134_CAEEL|nr:Cyclin-like domain-containing protein [Caenorhabditis elegans]CCD61287.1 Cyclin-like domain-containing protein [Caenorhabditis elegans]|eukprot:NP_494154.1 CYclin A [Caenorhabditis elegans]